MSRKRKSGLKALEWNIAGISDEVMASMKEDNADINDVDDYVKKICYYSVFSKEPDDAVIVSEQVRQMVLDKFNG
jgi:hypothetical protein